MNSTHLALALYLLQAHTDPAVRRDIERGVPLDQAVQARGKRRRRRREAKQLDLPTGGKEPRR